jgi:hypothetical protein
MSTEVEAVNFLETLKRRVATFQSFETTLNNLQKAFRDAQDVYERSTKIYDGLTLAFSQLLGTHAATKSLTPAFIKVLENDQAFVQKTVP